MSLIVVHLRWNDPGADRFEEIIRAVPQDGDLPSGCLSRRLRRQGGALTAEEAWDSDVTDGGRMDDLVTAMRGAGIEDSPQTAMFSVPAMFAVAYRRPAPATPDLSGARADAAIPLQRGPSTQEQLPQAAGAAAATASE